MSKHKFSRTIGASLTSLSLAFFGLSSIPHSANAQVDTVDEVQRILSHFICYEAQARSPLGFALLQDQFDRLDGAFDLAFVANPIRFCNPVRKQIPGAGGTPIVNPLNHLTMHLMLTLPPGPDRVVVVENQFGAQRMQVRDWSFLLAVPTDKNREGPPSGIDHFKCHFVTAGDSVDQPVALFDQFFPDGVTTHVGPPQLLCNPTRKIHPPGSVGIFEPDAHLACYAMEPTPPGPDIRIDNQFVAAAPVSIGPGVSLCVPSLKRIVDSRLPDLTIELPARVEPGCAAAGCSPVAQYAVHEIAGVGVPGPFDIQITASSGQSATITIPAIGPGATINGSATLGPPGPNCYDPDCTTDAMVDINNAVQESNENNNTDTRTDQG